MSDLFRTWVNLGFYAIIGILAAASFFVMYISVMWVIKEIIEPIVNRIRARSASKDQYIYY